MSINGYLTTLASSLIIRDSEKESIARSISTLQTRLNLYFKDEIEEQFCFGSYTRGTILPRKADESSDIDYMIVFKNSEGYMPQTFFRKLKEFANHWYGSSEIYRDSPTIVLELKHIKFELVPAYSSLSYWSKQYYIPAPRATHINWIQTDPNEFNSKIKNKNVKEQSIIKPLVRLLKYWNTRNGHVYSSYELEQHIIDQGYWFENNLRDYFYKAVASLQTFGLNSTDTNKVNSFKNKVEQIRDYEQRGYEPYAESELKILLPNI
ncbi:Nucleotidyltransferase domain [uncultured Clostridium sp.]|nr:Nucleotidyltransferase domain [uncultured Clostridium sp.]SCJ44833.1 Nucleotidyltransferase domain [uncultured Clostridium sp.]